MTRWQRLNLGEEVITGYRNDAEWQYARNIRDLPAAKFPDGARRAVIGDGMDLVFIAHLEYPLRRVSIGEAAAAVVSTTLDYFFGTWRDSGVVVTGERLSSEEFRRRHQSLDLYRYGLVCALIAGDGEAVERLACWPDMDRRGGCPLPDLSSMLQHLPKVMVKRRGVQVPVLETTLADYILFPGGLRFDPATSSCVMNVER